MQSPCPEIEVQYIDVQKQKGQSDCGFFAIAFVTSFAHLQDPASITYDQAKMRTHENNLHKSHAHACVICRQDNLIGIYLM